MKTKGVTAAALLIAFVVAVLNNVYKYRKIPTVRFFVGCTAVYIAIQTLAKYEDEIAKNVAMAICVFVILGEGGGLLDHFLGKGTSNSTLDTQPPAQPTGNYPSPSYTPTATRRDTGMNAVSTWTGLYAEKPVIPNSHVVGA